MKKFQLLPLIFIPMIITGCGSGGSGGGGGGSGGSGSSVAPSKCNSSNSCNYIHVNGWSGVKMSSLYYDQDGNLSLVDNNNNVVNIANPNTNPTITKTQYPTPPSSLTNGQYTFKNTILDVFKDSQSQPIELMIGTPNQANLPYSAFIESNGSWSTQSNPDWRYVNNLDFIPVLNEATTLGENRLSYYDGNNHIIFPDGYTRSLTFSKRIDGKDVAESGEIIKYSDISDISHQTDPYPQDGVITHSVFSTSKYICNFYGECQDLSEFNQKLPAGVTAKVSGAEIIIGNDGYLYCDINAIKDPQSPQFHQLTSLGSGNSYVAAYYGAFKNGIVTTDLAVSKSDGSIMILNVRINKDDPKLPTWCTEN